MNSRPCSRSTNVETSYTTTDGDRPYITTSRTGPLMCHYEVPAKDTLSVVVSTYLSAFVCNTHDGDQPGEHWVAMYVDEIGHYFEPYGQNRQHAEFTKFMNEHCSQWSSNDHILRSTKTTFCDQYCVAFLMFRCRNISMHAFASLYSQPI